jgi:hypothetical protein
MEVHLMEIVFRRPDGTFVAIVNGNPYHVTLDDPLYEAALASGGDAPLEPEFISPPQTDEERIVELKQLLRDTDYVVLSDYDKDKPDVLAQRQAWRDEIRALENTQ